MISFANVIVVCLYQILMKLFEYINMNLRNCLFLFTVSISIFNSVFCDQNNKINKYLIIKKIEQHFLSNFDWECESLHSDDNGSFNNFLQSCIEQQRNMKEITKAKIIFGMLNKDKDSFVSNIVDMTTWDDLNLYRNLKSKKAITVAKRIDRTQTYLGKVTICCILGTPIDDVKILKRRQAVSKLIIEDQELYNFLKSSFYDLKNYENLFFSFYSNDIFKSISQSQYTSNEKINNNIIGLGIKNLVDHQKRIVLFLAKSLATVILPVYGVSKIFDINQSLMFNTFSERLISSGDPLLGIISMLKDSQVQGCTSLFAALNCALSAKNDYEKISDNFRILECLHEKLSHVSKYLSIMFEIAKKLENYPEIYKELEIFKIKELLNKPNELIKILSTDTFKNNNSIFFNWAKTLLAFKLMHELKNDFNDALCSLGKVEAFTSLASLYKEYQSKKVFYSFVNYLSLSSPCVILEDFWNPLIDDSNVVTNSIAINDMAKNIIITGVNKGGKSTNLKAITINILLAQTFGISASKLATITPFCKIGTYINIVDDIQSGNSLFESQQKRVYELLKMTEIPVNKFWFMALDEPFNGTNLLTSQAILYSLAKKKLALFDNNISIISTHFPLMGTLENENPKFCNYKVMGHIDSDTKVNCPFILKRGLSDQNIALDILRCQGFDKDVLDEASKIINDQKTRCF